MEIWNNSSTMNLPTVMSTNILSNPYFKNLFELRTYHEVLAEIDREVHYLEPWVGQTQVPSTAFCLLFKLFTLKLTEKQLTDMLDNSTEAFIRAMALLYLRLCCPPKQMWDWFYAYIDDAQEVQITRKGDRKTIGELTRELIEERRFCNVLLPRIPAQILNTMSAEIKQWDESQGRSTSAPVKSGGQKRRRDRDAYRRGESEKDDRRGRYTRDTEYKDKERGRDRGGRDRGGDRYRERGRERDRSDRDRGNDRYRDRDRGKERDYRERDRDYDYSRQSGRRDRYADRYADRDDSSSRYRGERDGGAGSRERSRDGDRDRHRDRERDRDYERRKRYDRGDRNGREGSRDASPRGSSSRSPRSRKRSRSPDVDRDSKRRRTHSRSTSPRARPAAPLSPAKIAAREKLLAQYTSSPTSASPPAAAAGGDELGDETIRIGFR